MSPAYRAMYFTDRTREQLFETFWRQAFGRASIARRRLSVREFVPRRRDIHSTSNNMYRISKTNGHTARISQNITGQVHAALSIEYLFRKMQVVSRHWGI